MRLVSLLSAAAVLGFAAVTAGAAEFKAGTITVDAPWARATPSANAGAFMTIRNSGDAPDRLLAVKSAIARETMIHTSYKDGEVMKMRMVDAIDVPAHGEAALKPGGFHIMLVGLTAPLFEGGSVPITLVFEKAGELAVTATVEKAGAMGPAMMMMHHGEGHMEHHQPPGE